jgi:adenylate kinase family enzyme
METPTLRIHVLGASGSGTTTLGAALAERIGCVHLDADEYFWEPTDPPFQSPRSIDQRQSLLEDDTGDLTSWVLSGSLCGWGDFLIPSIQLVVFLWVPTEIRLARLRAREEAEFGADALAPGGTMRQNHREFLDWAASYDDGDTTMRSMAQHQDWLIRLPCPVLRIEGKSTVENLVQRVLESE